MDIMVMGIKVIGALIVFILLMLMTLKLSNNKFSAINDKRNIKVLDKAQLSKDVSIQVVKIGNRGYIMSISSSKAELIKELSAEEVNEIELVKAKQQEKSNEAVDTILNSFKDTIIKLKKRKNKYEK